MHSHEPIVAFIIIWLASFVISVMANEVSSDEKHLKVWPKGFHFFNHFLKEKLWWVAIHTTQRSEF